MRQVTLAPEIPSCTVLIAMLILALVGDACAQSGQLATALPLPRLEVDSAEYHLTVGVGFAARIPFRYFNGPDIASLNQCVNTPLPALEKHENGKWVTAYSDVVLSCLSPPFRIGAHMGYADTLRPAGGPRGSGFQSGWQVSTVPGEYRLRWVLRAGPNPNAPSASSIEVISRAFRLVLPEK